MKLGLLFGQDIDATNEDLPEALTFQHKLIQEYFAAIFLSKKIEDDPSHMNIAFQTWEQTRKHREVLKFTCDMLETLPGGLDGFCR